jgi:hypothetical protein
MSVHEQVVYRNIYTFAIKKRLNEPFSEICPAPAYKPASILSSPKGTLFVLMLCISYDSTSH